MYRIVICEDDNLQRNEINSFISEIFSEISNNIKIFEFSSAEEVIESKLEGIDIYFLDIQMDNLNGMDLAKEIRKQNDTSKIIFITSLLEHVQDGYVVKAYRYLIKPIKYEDLKEHILSCISDIIKERENFIIIKENGITYKVNTKEITYIEIIKKDITIHTIYRKYNIKNRIKNLEKELNMHNFFRCHKSYLINMEYIDFIGKDNLMIKGAEIPVSKYRMSGLKTKLTNLLGAIIC
ncbi:LytR/AlgR family response regulator transcription factor [Paraclostridium sordellii]|uniref:LytR/AlgR family response regulator transcription factor n=1 Tax=Paraclostridium sordellii TaxID=1505 RepID=UPI0005E37590|nr:LytTR family DNA-binding domain-containing protein [Paeniclostridium sordellii]CEO21851.1 two-component signal transduction response regulator [[Clostridium] sordellii] [Paeniclostridium sordellii]CEQ13878.1 two-component signal transduction response regulator [[Clostridium] sordellii] [Paeniclostridium sordellii]